MIGNDGNYKRWHTNPSSKVGDGGGDLTFLNVPLCHSLRLVHVLRQHLGSPPVWVEAITLQKDGPRSEQVEVVDVGDPSGGTVVFESGV